MSYVNLFVAFTRERNSIAANAEIPSETERLSESLRFALFRKLFKMFITFEKNAEVL